MNKYKIFGFCLLIISTIACKKSEYLAAKPDQALIIPKTVSDFQAIVDNHIVMNGTVLGVVPAFGEASTDDYYILDNFLNSSDVLNKKFYTWDSDDSWGDKFKDWEYPYAAVLYSNIVIDGLNKITPTSSEQTAFDNAKGSALFFRAFNFFNIAQEFAPPYNKVTASSDLGIPLRLTSDVNEQIRRSDLQATYDRIINDLKEAASLLPDFPLYKTRPSKWAVNALLARIYLAMRDYDNAFTYSNQCLQLRNTLMDYNNDPDITTGLFPFKTFNKEVIFHAMYVNASFPLISPGIAYVDSTLYNSYDNDDKRKILFFYNFPPGQAFVGTYDGTNGGNFAGIATDEIYLIRAECYARKNDITNAMLDLNTLIQKRWENTVPYPTITAGDAATALNKILVERRKELISRGTRWMDLRRFNKDGANITLTRIVNGQTYTLLPNSLKYVFLIPSNVIGFHSDMPQNPR